MTADALGGIGGGRGEDERDPDALDEATLSLVRQAAGLIRDASVPADHVVEATVQRVRVEAFFASIAGAVGGSLSRLAGATPDLLGLIDLERASEENGDG